MKPILYLPSEIHNRDWDTRLLMADYDTAEGFTVVVGEQWSPTYNAGVLPPGLVLIKTLNRIQAGSMKRFKDAGHLVAAMDEECFGVACDQGFLGYISREVAQYCDVLYANSPMHAKVLAEQIPELKNKIVTLGNPRMDLLVPAGRARFQPDADALRQRFGRFILFNSNTAQGNSVWESPDDYLKIQVETGALDANDAASVALFKGKFDFEASNTVAFNETLQWCIAHLSDHTIVVRPHPAERRSFWEEFAAKEPKVHIAFDSHHIPWMLAAEIVVHTNSTTGLEAAVLEKPVVNLMPDPAEHWSQIYIPSRVNPTFVSWREATAAIDAYVKTGGGPLAENKAGSAELRRYFPDLGRNIVSKMFAEHMIGLVKAHDLDASPFSLSTVLDGRYQAVKRENAWRSKFSKPAGEARAHFAAIRRVSQLTHPLALVKLSESGFAIKPAGQDS